MKVLLLINMAIDEYRIFKKYATQKMIVDIGYDYDDESGWAFVRRKLLCVKPVPEELDAVEIAMQCGMDEVSDKLVYQVDGYNRCIERILGEEDEIH